MSRLSSRDRGASAVEYALIVAAVALVLIPAAIGLKGVIEDVLFNSCVATAKENAGGSITSSQAADKCD